MNKKEIQQRVFQNGKPLDLNKFEWDEKAKVFSTVENDLVLDFSGISRIVFKTGFNCTFKTGFNCTFKTGSDCTFKTGFNCTFKTGKECVVVRRDIYEVIELKENQKIKLNPWGVKGYDVIEEEVKGDTTKYYVCKACNKPSDPMAKEKHKSICSIQSGDLKDCPVCNTQNYADVDSRFDEEFAYEGKCGDNVIRYNLCENPTELYKKLLKFIHQEIDKAIKECEQDHIKEKWIENIVNKAYEEGMTQGYSRGRVKCLEQGGCKEEVERVRREIVEQLETLLQDTEDGEENNDFESAKTMFQGIKKVINLIK